MQATPSLDFIPPKPPELNNFVQMLQKSWRNLTTLINNKIGFGDGTNKDNIDGVWANVVAPVAPNTNFVVTHNLGRVPVGYWVMQKDRACDVYTGSVAATSSQITLRASVASAVLRLFVLCFTLALLGVGLQAQTTSVTLQVTDTGGQAWFGGTWQAVLQSPPGAIPYGPPFYQLGGTTPVPNQNQSGSLDGTASATMILTQNAFVLPTQSQWYFTVCSQATAPCFSQYVTITAVTTVNLTPPPISVAAGPGVRAYADVEVTSPVGNTYYNVTIPTLRICQTAVGTACSVWASVGAGGGGGAPSVGTLNTVQASNSVGGFQTTSIIDDSINSLTTVGNSLTVNGTSLKAGDAQFKGPNPAADIRSFGKFVTVSSTTATTVSGTPTVTLGAASNFKNGEFVTVFNAGTPCGLSIPGAPTVTPSVNSGGINTVPAGVGALNFAYEIVAACKNGGYAAPSASGSTSTGNTLGLQTATITTMTRANNVTTVNTSAAHGYVPGEKIHIRYFTTSDPSFEGFWIVATVPTSTSFTYLSNIDTRTGAVTSGTGGTIYGFNVNTVTWPAVTNAWKYYILGRTGGTFNVLAASMTNS